VILIPEPPADFRQRSKREGSAEIHRDLPRQDNVRGTAIGAEVNFLDMVAYADLGDDSTHRYSGRRDIAEIKRLRPLRGNPSLKLFPGSLSGRSRKRPVLFPASDFCLQGLARCFLGQSLKLEPSRRRNGDDVEFARNPAIDRVK
jgi:hypothetical protein